MKEYIPAKGWVKWNDVRRKHYERIQLLKIIVRYIGIVICLMGCIVVWY